MTARIGIIGVGGRTFLTDPWFSTKPGYYQGEPIAIGIPDLPHLDGVLISHAHYDHCDLDAFAAFRDKGVAMVVPSTVFDLAHAHGFTDVTALDPWEHVEIGDVTITATPAKHRVHEITFVLRSGAEAVYFAGDTLFIPELREIPERLGHISVALLSTNGRRLPDRRVGRRTPRRARRHPGRRDHLCHRRTGRDRHPLAESASLIRAGPGRYPGLSRCSGPGRRASLGGRAAAIGHNALRAYAT